MQRQSTAQKQRRQKSVVPRTIRQMSVTGAASASRMVSRRGTQRRISQANGTSVATCQTMSAGRRAAAREGSRPAGTAADSASRRSPRPSCDGPTAGPRNDPAMTRPWRPILRAPCAPPPRRSRSPCPTARPNRSSVPLEVANSTAMLRNVATAHSEAMRIIRSRLSHSPVTRLLTHTPATNRAKILVRRPSPAILVVP